MGAMAKKKEAGKAPKNRARDLGEVVPLGVEVSARHREGVDECVRREQRTKRVIIERALEAYFYATGIWSKPAEPTT